MSNMVFESENIIIENVLSVTHYYKAPNIGTKIVIKYLENGKKKIKELDEKIKYRLIDKII